MSPKSRNSIPPPAKLKRPVSLFVSKFRNKIELARKFPAPSKLTRQVADCIN